MLAYKLRKFMKIERHENENNQREKRKQFQKF
jgi:hypothetical protein